jgi:hypothetical protein
LEPYLRGIYRLPRTLLVEARVVLNPAELPIQVGSVSGQAMLPELRAGAFGRPRLITPPLLRGDKAPGWSDGRGPSTAWGWGWGERFVDARDAFIHRLAMRFPLSGDKTSIAARTSQLLFESIGPWSQRLADWLEIVLYQIPTSPFVPPLSRRPTLEERDGLWLDYVDAEGTQTKQLAVPGPISTIPVAMNRIEESTWRAILSNVGKGLSPPTERLLLRDARVAIEEEHPRRAVLDAGTATEIALSRLLDDRLQGVPIEVAKLVRDQNRELGRLRNALRNLGVLLPTSLQPDLIKLRNDAIHIGAEPSIEQAVTALSLARHVVEQAQPLDDILHRSSGKADEAPEEPQ